MKKNLSTSLIIISCLLGVSFLLSVGGSENIRAYWKNFIENTNILVFVVDSANRSRVEEAGNALKGILREEKLAYVPVVVISNKQVSYRPNSATLHLH